MKSQIRNSWSVCEIVVKHRTLYLSTGSMTREIIDSFIQKVMVMSTKRHIEIFSAGCSICIDVIARVRSMACSSCEIDVLDLTDASVAERAASLGVRSIPAVAVNGKLADCCTGRGVSDDALRAAGIGVPL